MMSGTETEASTSGDPATETSASGTEPTSVTQSSAASNMTMTMTGVETETQEMTTSTIFATQTRTITHCPATVTNCPVGPTVVTETVAISTTVCPVEKPSTTKMTTSTIYATQIRTITHCASDVTNCPNAPTVVTETVAVGTTVCPVTQEPSGAAPSGTPSGHQTQGSSGGNNGGSNGGSNGGNGGNGGGSSSSGNGSDNSGACETCHNGSGSGSGATTTMVAHVSGGSQSVPSSSETPAIVVNGAGQVGAMNVAALLAIGAFAAL